MATGRFPVRLNLWSPSALGLYPDSLQAAASTMPRRRSGTSNSSSECSMSRRSARSNLPTCAPSHWTALSRMAFSRTVSRSSMRMGSGSGSQRTGGGSTGGVRFTLRVLMVACGVWGIFSCVGVQVHTATRSQVQTQC